MTAAKMPSEFTGMPVISTYEEESYVYSSAKDTDIHAIYSLDDEPRWADLAPATETKIESNKSSHRWRGKIFGGALLAATGAALLFEQSPGNESVRATAAFNVLEDTEDEFIAGAVTVAGLTMAIEGATSILIAAGLNRNSHVFEKKLSKFRNKLNDDDDTDTDKKASLAEKLTDTGITCTIGPGMVVFRRHFQEEDRTFLKDIKTATGYCAVGSVVSGGIGYMAVGGVAHADKVGLGVPAEYFVDYATDWKFWTALLAGGYAIKYAKQGIGKIRSDFNEGTEIIEPPVTE